MAPDSHFVVTPWRNRKDLLQVRRHLYGADSVRQEAAVNQVFAWRSRKPDGLPLLLDSTADIVDVVLQDQRDALKHNSLRLLYATALARFITGLADTQIDLVRDRPSWFPPGKSLQLPYPLLELRHRIVHRHLPSLAELKRAAQDSLDWLWEWYWSQLDYAFDGANVAHSHEQVQGPAAVKETLQAMLKTYVKERKHEIKTRKQDAKAVENATLTYNLRYASSTTTSIPSSRVQNQNILLRLLVDDKMILPTDKKLGSSLSGAFLIWDPLLLAFCQCRILTLSTWLTYLGDAINQPSSAMATSDLDPIKEGMQDWLLHILTSDAWKTHISSKMIEDTLTTCFSEPCYWNLRTAEALLQDEHVPNRASWLAVLEAAKNEDGGGEEEEEEEEEEDMDVDDEHVDEGMLVKQEKKPKEMSKGPRKVMGLWKARPIGWLPDEFEDDE
ncbi:rRNA-processing protein las1 [Pleosporales sp. CAS-2024a]